MRSLYGTWLSTQNNSFSIALSSYVCAWPLIRIERYQSLLTKKARYQSLQFLLPKLSAEIPEWWSYAYSLRRRRQALRFRVFKSRSRTPLCEYFCPYWRVKVFFLHEGIQAAHVIWFFHEETDDLWSTWLPCRTESLNFEWKLNFLKVFGIPPSVTVEEEIWSWWGYGV